MYKDGRDIYFYDVVSQVWNRKYNGLKAFPHYELAKAIEWMFKNDRAEYVQSSTRQSVYVTKIRVHNNRCEILIGFSDPGAADPTLNDRPARKRRVVKKVGDEGLEHSARIIWHYHNRENIKPCDFFLEGAVGLRSTSIVRFFNRMLRECSASCEDFYVDDPEGVVDSDGNFKQIKTRPGIDLLGHPSKEFIRDLKKGELTEVELYTEREMNKVWDSNGYAIEDRRSLILKPNKAKHLPKAKAVLDGVFTKNVKDQYEYARVKFKTETSIARSVKIFSENYKLVNDDTYVKKERIEDLGGDLPNAFDDFHLEIMKRMRLLAGLT